jgi:hypothetical protein
MDVMRPSRSVTLATVVAGCLLAAGGFVLGRRAPDESPPAAVPVSPAAAVPAGDPIVIPSRVELPRR